MKTQIKIYYMGEMIKELDDKIRVAMESIGAVWYGQGYNHIDHSRDFAFDWESNDRQMDAEQLESGT